MAKLITFGNLEVRMDVKSTDSCDAKPPHVYFMVNGKVTQPHIYLSEVDSIVGNDRDEKDAIYWLREHKYELIKKYNGE